MELELIQGNGYSEADLMVVGDYARKYDYDTKKCLSGYYGKKFDSYFREAGFSIDKCYLTCVIKLYHKGLGVGNFGSDKKLLEILYSETQTTEEYFVDLLMKEINMINPSIILASGEFALRILTGKDGITKWRGSVLPLQRDLLHFTHRKDIKVVVTLHPSDIHVDESNEYLLKLDSKKAVELLFSPNRPIDYHEVYIARNFNDFLRFREQYPENPSEMTTDIETRYGFITCASVSYDGYKGICLPMYGALDIAPLERCRMSYLLAHDLNNPLIGKCNQNMGYDKRIYGRFGFNVEPVVWDTMLAAHTIACEFPKRLGFLTSIYTDMSYYKDEGREFDPKIHDIDQYYKYNAKDSISAFQIWQKQKEDLKEIEMYEFFTTFIMPLFDLYFRLESVGWKIDLKKRDELINKYEGFRNLKQIELETITEKPLNVHSPAQVGRFMELNDFPVLRHRTPGGNMVVSTGLNELKKMRSYDPIYWKKAKLPYPLCIRFIDLTLLIRRISKVIEYCDVGIHPWGRVHTSVNLAGTSSGRTSGGQTSDGIPLWEMDKGKWKIKFKQLGQSFQTVTKHGFIIDSSEDIEDVGATIGKDLREMYIPDTDMLIIEVDGSQAEARVVDVLSEDWDGLEEYGKIDKHCKVASMIFTNYTYEDLVRLSKKEKTEEGLFMRFIGKKGKHANNLGVGEYVLALTANIQISEARTILQRLDVAYPNTKRVFHAQVEEQLRGGRCLINPHGRKRFFYKKVDAHYVKVAYSFLPQSTVSDQTKGAMLRISSHPDFDSQKMWFVAENHDSITALVRRGAARTFMRIAKEEMERPIDMRKCSLSRDYQLVIPAEFSIGRRNWGTIKEIKKINLSR